MLRIQVLSRIKKVLLLNSRGTKSDLVKIKTCIKWKKEEKGPVVKSPWDKDKDIDRCEVKDNEKESPIVKSQSLIW